MKRATLTLVLGASILYYAILFLASGLFSPDYNPPPFFLAVPLLVFVLILASDLSHRSTVPAVYSPRKTPLRKFSREVQELKRQIEVGVESTPAYFEKSVVARLRDILVERVALETGMDPARVRVVLANPGLGPGLLRNPRLYMLLYSPPAGKGPARVRMLEEIVALVESWKP